MNDTEFVRETLEMLLPYYYFIFLSTLSTKESVCRSKLLSDRTDTFHVGVLVGATVSRRGFSSR